VDGWVAAGKVVAGKVVVGRVAVGRVAAGGWQGGGWAGGGGSEGMYAMRADRPLVAEDVSTTPPPADGNTGPKFPRTAWDNDLFALTFLPDFFTATVGGKTWDQYITLNPFPNVVMPNGTGAATDDKIDDLRILAVTERPEAMGEILNQHQNQQLCFMQLLTMTASSHPRTFFVMKLAARVGEVVMMRLKREFNRPRPTQYYPALYPPVPVPGHSSYPAGHALHCASDRSGPDRSDDTHDRNLTL
jgi:hypothetical protein